MTRFNTRIGAAVVVGLGAVYMIVALAMGHSARGEAPPDLSVRAAQAGLEVWQAARLMVEGQAMVVDIRTPGEYGLYHLPGSESLPGGGALREKATKGRTVVVVAAQDDQAQRVVGEARTSADDGRFTYLKGGARAWYLAFDLPVPLFSQDPPPRGYKEALTAVKAALADDGGDKQGALRSLETLAKANYQPGLLKASGKPKGGGAKKKVSGGCG